MSPVSVIPDCIVADETPSTGMFTVAAPRIAASVALAFLSTVAVAQHNDEIKGAKFGTGCQEAIKPMAAGLGSCTLSSSKIRMSCECGHVAVEHPKEHETLRSW